MGLLDDAIREHLDLKRQHGATEDELARQEAEALGPVTEEDVAAARSDVAGEVGEPEGGWPFDRVAENELAEEPAEPSFEWSGPGSEEIDVPSFVPAKPLSESRPEDELIEDLEEDLPPPGPETEVLLPADIEGAGERTQVGGPFAEAELEAERGSEGYEPIEAEPEASLEAEPAGEPLVPDPPAGGVSPAHPEPDVEPLEGPPPSIEPSSPEVVEAEPAPLEEPRGLEPPPDLAARPSEEEGALQETRAFQAIDLEREGLEEEGAEPEPPAALPEPGASEPEPPRIPEADPGPSLAERDAEPEVTSSIGSEVVPEPDLEPERPPDPAPDLEPEPAEPELRGEEDPPPLEPGAVATDPSAFDEPGEPALEAPSESGPFAIADDAEPPLATDAPSAPDPAAEQGSPPVPADDPVEAEAGPVTQVWSVVDEPGLPVAPLAEDPASELDPADRDRAFEVAPVADDPGLDPDPELAPAPTEADPEPSLGGTSIDEEPAFEPPPDAEEAPRPPLDPPEPSEPPEAGDEPAREEVPPREPPIAARGFFEETEEHETLWHEERPDPDFEN